MQKNTVIDLPGLNLFPDCCMYRKDAIEPTQSTAECRNNHARWVRDIDFSPTPNASFVNCQHHYFVCSTVRKLASKDVDWYFNCILDLFLIFIQ